MPKTHINLLTRRKNYERIESFLNTFRVVTISFGTIVLISAILLILLRIQAQAKNERLTSQKATYLSAIIQKKDIETKALYFNQKSSIFNTYLKNDVNFLPYYHLLQDYLPFASNSASIQNISYDNARNVTILLSFNNYNDFYNALNNLQDPKFLSIFDNLALDSFSIAEEKTNNYELTLKGKFKLIK